MDGKCHSFLLSPVQCPDTLHGHYCIVGVAHLQKKGERTHWRYSGRNVFKFPPTKPVRVKKACARSEAGISPREASHSRVPGATVMSLERPIGDTGSMDARG